MHKTTIPAVEQPQTGTIQYVISTGQQYKHICPYCGGGFNLPATCDNDVLCPLCEKSIKDVMC